MEKTQKELRKEAEEVKAWYDGLDAEFEYQERVLKEVEKMKNRKYVVKRPNEAPVECKKPFYFTYGSSPSFPFCEGYSMIYAKSEHEARERHAKRYGYTKDGYLRFAFSYTHQEARALGIIDPSKCHEIITKE